MTFHKEPVINKFKPTPKWILIISGIALVVVGIVVGIYFGMRIEKHRSIYSKF